MPQRRLPEAARSRRQRVLDRLALLPRYDPERERGSEHPDRLADLPWSRSTAAGLDPARTRALLDAGLRPRPSTAGWYGFRWPASRSGRVFSVPPSRAGAAPGRLLDALRRLGPLPGQGGDTPLVVLGELDWLGEAAAGALFGALDPARIRLFHDRYVALPLDLGRRAVRRRRGRPRAHPAAVA